MNLQRYLFVLVALGLASPHAALAVEEQPTIVLDLPPLNSGLSKAPDRNLETPPSADTTAVPQIQLPSPVTTSPETEAGSTRVSPAIPERDRGEDTQATVAQDWLLPLIPAIPLTDGAQIGASQPAPGILRLTGEVASVDLVMDLPDNATIPAELLLTLRSTVNVLPEVASVTITINDAAEVVLPLNHLSGFETVDIPTTGLTSGRNRLHLDFRQPHRIFCGPEASFNVWTEIDLPRSGLLMDGGALPADAAGLALALRAQAASGRPLPVLAAEDEDSGLLQELADKLSADLGGQMPIKFLSFYELQPASPLSVALISSNRSHVELRKGADGGLVVQIEHAGGQLPPLDDLLPDVPNPPTGIPTLTPGNKTSLAKLGQSDIIGNTRYFRHDIPFVLPDDWLLLSNQKGRLNLRYGFADMLPKGAMLLVKINEETIRLLPLDQNGGHMQAPLPIIFSANLLHSGRNDLSFEMMVPGNPPDAICPLRRVDMLVVTRDSTLLVPRAPAMTFAGISKPLSEIGPKGISVPQGVAGRAELERTAIELGTGLTLTTPSPDPSANLNVVSIGDIGLIPLDAAGVSGRDVQEALLDKRPAPAGTVSIHELAPRYRLTEDDPQSPNRLDADAEAEDKATPVSGAGITALKDWIFAQPTRLKAASFAGSDESLSGWLRSQQGSALLIRPNREEAGELWLVLGPQASVQSVRQGLMRLRDSGLAKGEAAILAADDTWQVWSGTRPPELREPLKISNLRSVLGNYASWSPLLFTVVLLGLSLLSAIPALLFVLFTRRRGQI